MDRKIALFSSLNDSKIAPLNSSLSPSFSYFLLPHRLTFLSFLFVLFAQAFFLFLFLLFTNRLLSFILSSSLYLFTHIYIFILSILFQLGWPLTFFFLSSFCSTWSAPFHQLN
ncbi:Uncharacterized protein TCM_003685 [Theobroma cacao]|uniref:Uncharacterized protein n=1 Tax=Theobroma cacao TaxID=3641 RepID=A0A061DP83_THECC|nr:Uncharacterized protein TCM_003685 [Theobroma cacao]